MLPLIILIAAICWCVYGAGALARGKQTHRRWNATFGGCFIAFVGACLLDQRLRELRRGYGDADIVEQIYVAVLFFLIPVGFGSALAYACGLSRKRWEERRRSSSP